MTDKTRLNSLDGFRKQPDMLVLEEHGHCEVPAGCGGVILRWRNPKAGVPITAYLYTPVEAGCYMDGNKLVTARFELPAGRHVIGVLLRDVDLSRGLLMFAALHDPKTHQPRLPQRVVEPSLKILSAEDNTWRFCLEKPADDWMTLAFDDQSWPALINVRALQPAWDAFGAFQFRQCEHQGAVCLGIPSEEPLQKTRSWWSTFFGGQVAQQPPNRSGDIWIRRAFDVPDPLFLDAKAGPGQP